MYAVEDRQGDLVYNMLRAIKANKASVNAKDAVSSDAVRIFITGNIISYRMDGVHYFMLCKLQ